MQRYTVSGGTITHHQERKQLYLRHLVSSHRYCYLPLSWKRWNWFECAVGGVAYTVSGGTITHHQERKQLYLRHLVSSYRYCYLPLSWKRWNWFECAVGGVRHPQHTQTSSICSTIAADSNNGMTIPDVVDTVVCAPDDG